MKMEMETPYRSVAEMVEGLADDQAFVADFARQLDGRQVIKLLTVLRTKAGLSQQELAEKLKCTQSKVSKLERSNDADIRFGDLLDYARALGSEIRLSVVPQPDERNPNGRRPGTARRRSKKSASRDV
jgi:predicted XRE-type DNA-binding protein